LLTPEARAASDWSFWRDEGMSEGYPNMTPRPRPAP